jgi:hypothetical protein
MAPLSGSHHTQNGAELLDLAIWMDSVRSLRKFMYNMYADFACNVKAVSRYLPVMDASLTMHYLRFEV